MRLRFRFRTVPFVATVVLVTLGILLGNWQVRRAAEKTALQARLAQRSAMAPLVLDGSPVDPAAIEYRRVVARGEFVPAWPLYLGNRPLDGRAGFIVLMPFRIAGSSKVVLVARGWAPRDPGAQDRVPDVAAPAGRTTVEGLAVQHPARVMALGTEASPRPGAIVQNLDMAAFARASGMDVLPVLVEQTGADAAPAGTAAGAARALVRKWPAPAVDVDRNRGYAFQWYALAAMAFLFFVMTGFRSGTKQAG
jgi:cytochrome oxidase assembly protein ShyY1